MNILRYPTKTQMWGRPWDALTRLSNDLEQWFSPSLGQLSSTSENVADWAPAVDIKEEDTQYVLRADVPGVNPKDIEVEMENGSLAIRGHRQTETTEDEAGYRRVERFSGTFFRRFQLPEGTDSEKITARTDNGVLEVVIPKQAQVKPKKIKVQG